MIGRPGIGKTVLTEKIIRDWANEIDEYYCGKIPLVFKFRWFNMDEYTNLPLKNILQIGTESVSEESFEGIYQELTKDPQKAILIFDGLDEFNGNPNDPNTCMSGMNLFIKVIMGFFLRGATVLVTSRPTAENFFSRFDFERTVEIIGFTPNKVKQYVTRFCANNNRTDLKPKIWSHINSSSELLNLCYIPENCYIVCFALSARAVPIDMSLGGCQPNFGPLKWVIRLGPPIICCVLFNLMILSVIKFSTANSRV